MLRLLTCKGRSVWFFFDTDDDILTASLVIEDEVLPKVVILFYSSSLSFGIMDKSIWINFSDLLRAHSYLSIPWYFSGRERSGTRADILAIRLLPFLEAAAIFNKYSEIFFSRFFYLKIFTVMGRPFKKMYCYTRSFMNFYCFHELC